MPRADEPGATNCSCLRWVCEALRLHGRPCCEHCEHGDAEAEPRVVPDPLEGPEFLSGAPEE